MTTLLSRGGVAPRAAQRPPRVLVADDEDVLRDVLARQFRRRGFEVVTAADGAEAVELYLRSTVEFDVVLMDVNMPGMGGPEALDAIRAVDPAVRCCFMTADGRPGRRAELLARGAAAVLGKPFASVPELCGTLERLAFEGAGPTGEGAVPWTS